MVHFPQLMKPYLWILLISFSLLSYFFFYIPSKIPYYTSLSCLHGHLWLWQFLRFFLFLIILTIWKWNGQLFVECPWLGVFLMFFSLLDLRCEFWGGKLYVQVPFSSYHIKGIYYQHELSLMMLGINYFKMLFKMLINWFHCGLRML